MSLVGLVQANKTSCESLKKAIERSLGLISFNFEGHTQKVVIKPNLCYYSDYSTGRTTNPLFVGALIDVLRERISANPEIYVVESDATTMKCEHAFRFLGYEKMAKEKSVTLVNLTEDKSSEVRARTARKSFKFLVPETIASADLLVNVPVIKLHNLTGISGALKNIYGCNPYHKKVRLHHCLDDAIVCLNKIMKFDLCLVDAIFVRGITPAKLKMVIASVDPVATDVVASKIMEINPTKIGHVMLAFKEGVGNIDFALKGCDLQICKRAILRVNRAFRIREFVRSRMLSPLYYYYFNWPIG